MRTGTLALAVLAAAGTTGLASLPASAANPIEQQKRFEAAARAGNQGFGGFSAPRGAAFFNLMSLK